jgi:hypothetical protein
LINRSTVALQGEKGAGSFLKKDGRQRLARLDGRSFYRKTDACFQVDR